MGFNNMMHAIIINYYKWVALISFLGEKKEKTRRREKEKKNIREFARPSLELSSSRFQYVYQRIELT